MKPLKMTALYAAIPILIFLFSSCASQRPPVKPVDHVDLDRYTGKWYEIAAYPKRFEKGCQCTTAEYMMCDRGYVMVRNRCRKGGRGADTSEANGKAFVTKNSGNAKLKVQFFWPFRAKYWIIDLGADYSYTVVSDPKRRSLWVLSRTPHMSDDVYTDIITRIKYQGLDEKKLKKTVQE